MEANGTSGISQFSFERRVALFTGVAVIIFVLYLVARNEEFASENLVVLMRIALSVAVGIVGATIPGFLSVEYNAGGFVIRAAGALALSVMTFFGTPKVEPLKLNIDDSKKIQIESRIINYLSSSLFCGDARDESSKMINSWPDYAQGYNLLGVSHYCLGNYDIAEKYFNKARELDNSNPRYKFNLGAALVKTKKFKEARSIYEKVNQEYLNNGKVDAASVYNYAITLLLVGEYDLAKSQFVKIESDSSYKLNARFGIEISRLMIGDTPQNIEEIMDRIKYLIKAEPYFGMVINGETPPGSFGKALEPYVWVLRLLNNDLRDRLEKLRG